MSDLRNAIKALLSAMEMQEGPERGDFEITQPNAWAVWTEAKAKARDALADDYAKDLRETLLSEAWFGIGPDNT